MERRARWTALVDLLLTVVVAGGRPKGIESTTVKTTQRALANCSFAE